MSEVVVVDLFNKTVPWNLMGYTNYKVQIKNASV